jgi:hypothetical protein
MNYITLISGMPLPLAIYITFPPVLGVGIAGGVSSVRPLILICGVRLCSLGGETEGRELLVIIVALELIVPKINASPT